MQNLRTWLSPRALLLVMISGPAAACGDDAPADDGPPDADNVAAKDASADGEASAIDDAAARPHRDAAVADAGVEAGMPVLVGSGANAGVGLACDERTPCPSALSCDRLPDCFGGDCPTYCMRQTTSCVGDPCGESAWCEPVAASERGTCVPRVTAGQECSGPPLQHPDINQCAEGLFCSAETDTCVPVLQPGARCPDVLWINTEAQACMEGYACRPTGADGSQTCAPNPA